MHFGFLKGKSTTAQLLQVLYNRGEKLDKRVKVDAIYLDVAKAFDRVNHELLLKMIQRFGICGTILSWLEDYLTDRVQRVTVLGVNSKSLPVLSGLPQGSILGPRMFLICEDDLSDVATSTSVALFADDTKCHHSIKRMEDGACLQRDLDQINQWCDLWCDQSSDVQVKTMEAQEDLVVLVTRHLKWNSQVLAACSKANRMLGFIRRSAFDTHEQRVCKLLYTSLVRSKLAYCSQVWAPQAVNLILDIERIQRRATNSLFFAVSVWS